MPDGDDIESSRRQIEFCDLSEMDIEAALPRVAGSGRGNFRPGDSKSTFLRGGEKTAIARPDIKQAAARGVRREQGETPLPHLGAGWFFILPCLEGAAGVVGARYLRLGWPRVAKIELTHPALRDVSIGDGGNAGAAATRAALDFFEPRNWALMDLRRLSAAAKK